jgi:hypothetical protein
MYVGTNALLKSTDRGGSWKRISGDLSSRVNRDTVFVMGQKIGAVNYSPGGGPSTNPLLTPLYGAITTISESSLDGKVLYTGTDDGQLNVTRDGGATWTNVTKNVPGLPPLTFVTTVAASHHVAGRVYATFDGHFNDDENTYVYVSDDFGKTWRKIIDGLPKTSINRLAEDPRTPTLLVVSHAYGVHFSNDAGAHWHSLSTNMPTVPVRSIVFQAKANALIAGSYGRGVWVLDDVSPLQALTPSAVQRDAVLVSATTGKQWTTTSLGTTYGVGTFYAPNPEFDPVITYYLRDEGSSAATIRIMSAGGATVRILQGTTTSGLNRVVWDMHMESALGTERPAGRGGRGGGGGGGGGGRGGGADQDAGPLVVPGVYNFTIEIAGISKPLTGRLTVVGDPKESVSAADRAARQAAIMSLYTLEKKLAKARGSAQVAARQGGAESDSSSRRFTQTVAEIDRLIGLAGATMRNLESFNAAPSADQRQQLAWATEDANRAISTLARLAPGAPPHQH